MLRKAYFDGCDDDAERELPVFQRAMRRPTNRLLSAFDSHFTSLFYGTQGLYIARFMDFLTAHADTQPVVNVQVMQLQDRQ